MNFIKDLSELEIIELISEIIFPRIISGILPFGDDSIGTLCGGKYLIINSDMFIAKTDLPKSLDYSCAGWKAVTMSVSDIIAKGAKPYGFLMSLGLPRDLPLSNFTKLLKGISSALEFYDMYLLGGDTNEACDLIIDGITFGFSNSRLIPRKGLKEGDLIISTGLFGLTAVGLHLSLSNKTFDIYSQEEKDLFYKSICHPVARIDVLNALNEIDEIVASIDSSDGLIRSLYELSRANKLGILIENIPIHPAVISFASRNKLSPKEFALYGGEEFELIIGVRSDKFDAIYEQFQEFGITIYPVGRVIRKLGVYLYENGKIIPVEEKGWMHFKQTKY